jgi:hypothetical protein
MTEPLPDVVLDLGDIFDIDWWSKADVAYCASLLFSEEMMIRLSEKVRLMKPGSFFITLKPLLDADVKCGGKEDGTSSPPVPPSGDIVLVSDSFYKMSWHMARVYIYEMRETVEN